MKKLILLAIIAIIAIGCNNPHAENFTEYIAEQPQLVQAILDCKMSDIEKECTLLEMFMALGCSQTEACEKVDELVGLQTQTAGGLNK